MGSDRHYKSWKLKEARGYCVLYRMIDYKLQLHWTVSEFMLCNIIKGMHLRLSQKVSILQATRSFAVNDTISTIN